MDIKIMFANHGDILEWMALVDIVEGYFPGLDKEDYRKNIVKCIEKKEAICSRVQGKIVGILLFSTEYNLLAFMAVHPEYRKCGIAANMIKTMISAFPKGEDIWVTTYREDDLKGNAARSLYLRCGFEPDELVTEMGYSCQKFVFRT
jgi:GNAT superfamily N-acetyltransferase